jgi:hypothetical protein
MLFLAGLVANMIGERTRLPRVSFLLAIGILVGDAGFGLIPEVPKPGSGFSPPWR